MPCMGLLRFTGKSTLRHEPVVKLVMVEVTDDPAFESTAVRLWHNPVLVEGDVGIRPWATSLPI